MPNPTDNWLMQNAPVQLVERYFQLIEKWVLQYINAGYLNGSKKEDYLHEVKKSLIDRLEKKPTLKNSLKGFLTQQIRAICNKISDAEDLHILASKQPEQIVIKYAKLITRETEIYKSSGSFDHFTTAEIVSELNEVLLRRIVPKLVKFESNALFRSYFKTVIRNLLHETYKRLKRDTEKHTALGYEELGGDEVTPAVSSPNSGQYDSLTFEQHKLIFDASLGKHPDYERREFEFCLKGNYRLIFTTPDIRAYWHQCPEDLLVEMLSYFGISYHHFNKGKVFELLAEFVGWCLQKAVKPNTLQRKYSVNERSTMVNMLTFIGLPDARQFSFEDFVYRYYKGENNS